MVESPLFSVVQLGARMHYAVPRILHGAGMLGHLFTDISLDHGLTRFIKLLPPSSRYRFASKLRGRKVAGVPPDKITAFELLGYRYAFKLRSARTESDRLRSFMWAEKELSKCVLREGLPESDSIYAFNGAAYRLFEKAKHQGLTTVLEQTIAPKRIENEILAESAAANGEAISIDANLMRRFVHQEELEWQLADTIVCASEFVKAGLIECGVIPDKCKVVPYGVDLATFGSVRVDNEAKTSRTTNVLFVGTINSRKGVWTLLKSMKQLSGLDVNCRIVGSVASDLGKLMRACPPNTEIVGPLPRSSIPDELARADVFCLPSLCEGSATVTYEALAAGLPVVTTPNSGSIVRDEVDGLIVPHSDESSLAAALKRLVEDSEFRTCLARNALQRSRFGSLEAYSTRLVSVLSQTGKTTHDNWR